MAEQQVQAAPARNNVEQMAHYVMPGSMFNMIRNLEQIARILMGWSACTLEVFVRREQGERYLSIGRVILGWMTMQFFLGIANLQHSLSWIPGIGSAGVEAAVNQWYLTCYLVLSAVHLLRIWQRNHAGIPWHSRSFGMSWLDFLTELPPLRLGRYQLRVTEWMLYRFIEPAICFTAVCYLMPGSFTRSWLLWASLTMLIHNNMIYNARRERFLDMVDSHIESGYYNELRGDAMGQKSATRHVGYVEMPLPPMPMPQEVSEVDIAATVAATMGTTQPARETVLKNHEEA